MTEWPKYESHKVVQAAKIVEFDLRNGKRTCALVDNVADEVLLERFHPTHAAMLEGAQIGDWAMLYPDGFRSISPAKAFEEGYRKVEDGSLSLRQAIAQCAVQFRSYEQQHLAKTPPDVAKAETNATYAAMCEALLAQP